MASAPEDEPPGPVSKGGDTLDSLQAMDMLLWVSLGQGGTMLHPWETLKAKGDEVHCSELGRANNQSGCLVDMLPYTDGKVVFSLERYRTED